MFAHEAHQKQLSNIAISKIKNEQFRQEQIGEEYGRIIKEIKKTIDVTTIASLAVPIYHLETIIILRNLNYEVTKCYEDSPTNHYHNISWANA